MITKEEVKSWYRSLNAISTLDERSNHQKVIAVCHGDNADYDAEFILRACKNFHSLLEACKKIEDNLEYRRKLAIDRGVSVAYSDMEEFLRKTIKEAEDGWKS